MRLERLAQLHAGSNRNRRTHVLRSYYRLAIAAMWRANTQTHLVLPLSTQVTGVANQETLFASDVRIVIPKILIDFLPPEYARRFSTGSSVRGPQTASGAAGSLLSAPVAQSFQGMEGSQAATTVATDSPGSANPAEPSLQANVIGEGTQQFARLVPYQ